MYNWVYAFERVATTRKFFCVYQGYDENGKMWHDNKNITRALSIAAGLNILGQIHKKLLAF